MTNYSKVMRHHGKTFFWATSFLEKKTAENLYSIYAFCRRIDDLIDENPGEKNLHQDFYSITQAWDKDKFSGAFEEFKGMDQKNLPRESVIKEFLKGQTGDITHNQPKDMNELIVYCYRVAGAVGLMICDVIGIKDTRLKYFAIDLGIAMQLTNICRDINEDAKINRIYLPKNMIDLSLDSFKSPSNEDLIKINEARNSLLECADTYYKSGEKGIAYLPFKTARAVMIASKLYQAIGKKTIKNKISYESHRVYLNKLEKTLLTIKTLFKLNNRKNIDNHNAILHTSLIKLPDAHIK